MVRGYQIMAKAAAVLDTKTVAEALDTDPRKLRKFLRETDQGVGRGKRYALPSNQRQLTALSKKFTAWSKR